MNTSFIHAEQRPLPITLKLTLPHTPICYGPFNRRHMVLSLLVVHFTRPGCIAPCDESHWGTIQLLSLLGATRACMIHCWSRHTGYPNIYGRAHITLEYNVPSAVNNTVQVATGIGRPGSLTGCILLVGTDTHTYELHYANVDARMQRAVYMRAHSSVTHLRIVTKTYAQI